MGPCAFTCGIDCAATGRRRIAARIKVVLVMGPRLPDRCADHCTTASRRSSGLRSTAHCLRLLNSTQNARLTKDARSRKGFQRLGEGDWRHAFAPGRATQRKKPRPEPRLKVSMREASRREAIERLDDSKPTPEPKRRPTPIWDSRLVAPA